MARLGSRAGPARDQARRQVEPPVADPTRARAPGARPTMALSTRVEEAANPRDYVTVILPEFVPARWWQHLLHNQTALLIKGALLFRKRVVVVDVPFHLEE